MSSPTKILFLVFSTIILFQTIILQKCDDKNKCKNKLQCTQNGFDYTFQCTKKCIGKNVPCDYLTGGCCYPFRCGGIGTRKCQSCLPRDDACSNDEDCCSRNCELYLENSKNKSIHGRQPEKQCL
ncbi:hypothetical protein ACQ4LE_010327 [Meloidogyne hapla]